MKEGVELPAFQTSASFEKEYPLDKLNLLGVIICKWLFAQEEAKKEHSNLFEYLLKMIADDKKKNLNAKNGKMPLLGSNTNNGNHSENEGREPFVLPVSANPSYTALPGVHPLLTLALFGGFKNLNSAVMKEPLQQYLIASEHKSIASGENSDFSAQKAAQCLSTSNISIPIPQGPRRFDRPMIEKRQVLVEAGQTSSIINQCINDLSNNLAKNTLKPDSDPSHLEKQGEPEGVEILEPKICSDPTEDKTSMKFGVSPSALMVSKQSSMNSSSFSTFFRYVTGEKFDALKSGDISPIAKESTANPKICCKCMMAATTCNCQR